MAGHLNKVNIIGNLGADPEIKTMQSGDRVANLSIATTESWKDKTTGEKKEKTEWHRIVIFNQGLVKLAENYLKKGSKIWLEGQLETRSWEQDGQKRYTTEIVLRPFRGEIILLDSRGNSGGGFAAPSQEPVPPPTAFGNGRTPIDELEDEIPF